MRGRKFSFLIITLVSILALIQLWVSHHLATAGETLKKIEIETQRVKEENALLKEEISKLGSLKRIAQEAEKLGLVKAKHFLPLKDRFPVALKTSTWSEGQP